MREAINAMRAIVLGLWPITTWAAGESLGQTLGALSLADWLSLLILSSVSGLVALLHRVRRSFEATAQESTPGAPYNSDRQMIDWRIFAVAHMSGAMFVGAIAFLLLEAAGVNNFLEAAGIALASWSGARLADKWADAVGDRIGSVIGR